MTVVYKILYYVCVKQHSWSAAYIR